MSPVFYLVTVLLVAAQLGLPFRLAFLPLLIAGVNLGNVEILPELTAARIIIVAGLLRAMAGGQFKFSLQEPLDIMFVCFSAWALVSTLGHSVNSWVPSPLAGRAGLVMNAMGAYLYGRAYIPDISSFRRYALWLPLILIPLALGVSFEKNSQRNYYYILGASSEGVNIREGKVRAKGPFRHPILAGTAGATALPFAFWLWRMGQKKTAVVGLGACLTVVMASASSGPAAAAGLTIMGMTLFWRWRQHFRFFVWGSVAVALLYSAISGRGPWFLMARIDLAGGSTGWHRAQLIDRGLEFIGEWWFMGTDYTRHWMPTGVSWNPQHTDLTNYYLHLGVIGGLPLALLVMGFIAHSLRLLLKNMQNLRVSGHIDEYSLWCAGVSLLAHGVSFISISYFDQMFIYFYVTLGVVPGLIGYRPSQPAVEMRVEPQTAAIDKPIRFYS